MGTDETLAVVRQWLSERDPGEVPDLLTVRYRSGRVVKQSFPTVGPLAATGVDDAAEEDRPIRAHILEAVEDAKARMKGAKIAEVLKKSHNYGGRAVLGELAAMRRDGELSHSDDTHGYGYGLPFWDDEE